MNTHTRAHKFFKGLRICMKLVSLSGTFVCIHKSKWTSNFTEMAKITSSDSVSTIRKLSSHGKLQRSEVSHSQASCWNVIETTCFCPFSF